MASALFAPGREGFLSGEIEWDGSDISVSLVRGYTFNSAHKFVSDLTGAGGTLVATQLLGTKTVTNGVADAADSTFPTVAAGAAIPAIVVYQSSAVRSTGSVATSAQRLICYIDTATGLPVTPNGQNITVTYDNGSNRIFML